jgi:protease-4
MKKILKALLSLIGLFLIFVTLTCFYYFIKHTWFGPSTGRTAHVAVVEIKGVLLSSSRTVREIQEVLDTPQAKALVIRINSPGGLVAPSQEIFEAVKKADKKIPVVISMASVAASGGYYIALGGRKIIANPGTLTASIGVIMEFMNVEKLYQWAKIDAFSLTSGKLKDAGSPLRPMSPDEKNYFKNKKQKYIKIKTKF